MDGRGDGGDDEDVDVDDDGENGYQVVEEGHKS